MKEEQQPALKGKEEIEAYRKRLTLQKRKDDCLVLSSWWVQSPEQQPGGVCAVGDAAAHQPERAEGTVVSGWITGGQHLPCWFALLVRFK